MGKIFARRTRKIKDKCDVETVIVDDGLLMKCKNLRRPPMAQEILDEVKINKIIIK